MFKHTFDADYLLVSFEDEVYNDIKTTYKRLIQKSLETSNCVMEINEKNRNSFGKLRVKIM